MRWRRGRQKLGLYKGQPLANARAMVQPLAIVPADEKADAALLDEIADWCDRFTPLVSLDAPDGLLLDITGAAHLFGGEAAMLAHGDAAPSPPRALPCAPPSPAPRWRRTPWRAMRRGTIALPPGGEADADRAAAHHRAGAATTKPCAPCAMPG